jgi:hypothetical protein
VRSVRRSLSVAPWRPSKAMRVRTSVGMAGAG